MEYKDLIINSLSYYDECFFRTYNLLDGYVFTEKIESDSSDGYGKIIFSKNGKTLEFFYEIIFYCIDNINTLIWGWSLPYINGKLIQLSKRVLNYGLNMNIDDVLTQYLKFAISNSRIIVPKGKDRDILCGIFLYLTKSLYIYSLKEQDKEVTSYYVLFPVQDAI
jgi:hypothetical protein